MRFQPSSSKPKPRIPVNTWGLVLRVVIAVAVLLGSNSIRIPISVWLKEPATSQSTDTVEGVLLSALIFLVTPILVLIFLAVWMPLIERRGLDSISFPRWRGIIPGLIGGTLVVSLPVAIAWPIAMLFAEHAELDASTAEVSTQGQVGGALAFSYVVYFFVRSFLLQGIPEEFLYRGWLFSTTKSKPIITLIWTTLAFAVIHLASSGGQQSTTDFILYLVMPLGMGAIAGAVVLWTDNTWWAAGTHGGFHILLTVMTLLFPIDFDSSTWVVLGSAQVLIAIVLAFSWWKRKSR